MKKSSLLYLLTVMVLSIFGFHGCNGDNGSLTDSGGVAEMNPQIVTVYPPSGAQNVPPSSLVAVVFDQPMNTDSVIGAFHFSRGDSMHAWMDSLGHHGGPGQMGHMDHMDHMDDWLDDISHHGEFHWNDLHDSCAFVPDNPLMPNTEYMLMLRGAVQGQHGMFMDLDDFENDAFTHRFHTGR